MATNDIKPVCAVKFAQIEEDQNSMCEELKEIKTVLCGNINNMEKEPGLLKEVRDIMKVVKKGELISTIILSLLVTYIFNTILQNINIDFSNMFKAKSVSIEQRR